MKIWTFLTKPRGRGAKKPLRRRKRERGIAIVVVLVAISICLVITNQFGSTTVTDMVAAANYRDQMRSHFLARSALNLSELVIRIQQRLDNSKEFRGLVQITDFADQLMLAFCGGDEEVQAAVGFSPGTVKGLGADVGTCGMVNQIQTEDDKINLNCANSNNAAIIQSQLNALVYFPAYDGVFEDSDAEGWKRDREKQVNAIIDYIDTNTVRGPLGSDSRGTTEDYSYENLKDTYKAKGNYVDTLGEIKLVRGVDDRFWSLFGGAFTVYGGCKTNLSAITNSQLIAALLVLSAKNEKDPLLANPQKLFLLASIVAKAKQFGMSFSNTQDFVDFAKDPCGGLAGIMSKGSTDSAASQQASQASNMGIPGLCGADKVALELDKAKLDRIATAGPRRTYKVEAWGEIERKAKGADGQPIFPPIRSTITGVWDTKVVNQNARKTPTPNGQWVFLRED